jgi:hypothetical protein
MWASDTSNFFHVGSGGTAFVGGPRALSLGSYPGTVPQRKYWALEMGEDITNVSGGITVSIPNSGFSTAPYVVVTSRDGTSPGNRCNLGVALSTTFTVFSYKSTGASASSISFHWMAIGQRAL